MTDSKPARPFPRRHWGKLTIASVVLAPVLLLVAWAAISLSYAYSDGRRSGFNQKLSRKGWLCKTWEGELAVSSFPGQAPIIFAYSVRDDSVAREIQKLEGRQVSIDYEEHRGVPSSCFGETSYYAIGVRPLEAAPAAVPGAAPQAPQPTPAGAPPAVAPGAPPAP
jgi:hypothetical protein